MTGITVATPPTFRFRTTLLSHGWITLPPFGHDEEVTTLTRIECLRDGTVLRMQIRAADDEALEIEIESPAGEATDEQRTEITALVRRMLQLDLDLSGFYDLLRREDRYAWVERLGGGRLLRSPTVWEDLVKTLMTTNTNWGGTQGMVRRINELGQPFVGGENLYAFPTPERLAAIDPDRLAVQIRAGYRAPYLYELATAIEQGRLDVESWDEGGLPAPELLRRVRSLKGFGAYAAGTVLKLLGSFDELALDTAARGMFARRYNGGERATDAEIAAHYEPYGEWRGLVLWMDVLHEAIGDRLGV